MTEPVLLWFRKDLRLDDNLALVSAVASGRPVIAVYIRSTEEGPLGAAQDWWLHHGLANLARSLAARGNRLILRSGEPLAVLEGLATETGATHVFWNRLYDPHGKALGARVKAGLRARGLAAESFGGQLMHEPSRVRTTSGGAFRVYTPFWRAFEAGAEPRLPEPAPARIPAPDLFPASQDLADLALLPVKPDWSTGFSQMFTPGEEAALARLDWFVNGGIAGYRSRRDSPSLDATSRLSPHLALGEISPCRIWHATRGLSDRFDIDDVTHFRKELVWREFSYHLLDHFPDLAERNWNDRFDAFTWAPDAQLFSAWKRGQTGYPIIDAGMRQLWQHGWMHNRVRMIVASFLIKDLLVDWRDGEKWFRDTLVDADHASNAASWQWVAGSGADAAPFFRVFNPVLQGEKFDPDGAYVRQYVPELARLERKYIHRPHEAPLGSLRAAGITLGQTYPKPIVDHAKARDKALAAFARLKAEA